VWMNPQEKWTLTTLAHMVQCSPFHLTRMFCRSTGVPLHRFLLHARLSRAVDLLLETQQDLTALALDLGFYSHSHFTWVFRQKVGIPPSVFRNIASQPLVSRARQTLSLLLSRSN
jgi:AraC-like DNA-binding protein